jgi:hypothetical protein
MRKILNLQDLNGKLSIRIIQDCSCPGDFFLSCYSTDRSATTYALSSVSLRSLPHNGGFSKLRKSRDFIVPKRVVELRGLEPRVPLLANLTPRYI